MIGQISHVLVLRLVGFCTDCLLIGRFVYSYVLVDQNVGSLPGTMAAHKLLQAIKAKCTPEEAAILMRDLANPLKDDEGGDARYNPIKIDVFVQTLLFVGSKSFSHSCSAIARCVP